MTLTRKHGALADNLSHLDDPGVKNLYYLLDIIDGKASALLTYNGIILAVLTVVFSTLPAYPLVFSSPSVVVLLVLSFVANFVSLIYCSRIVVIKWPMLDGESVAKEIEDLCVVVDQRHNFLYQAGLSARVSALFFFIAIILYIFK